MLVWRNAHMEFAEMTISQTSRASREPEMCLGRHETCVLRLCIGILRERRRARFSEFRARSVKMFRESMKSARMSRPGCVKTSIWAAVKFYRRHRLFPSRKHAFASARERRIARDLYRLREPSNGPENASVYQIIYPLLRIYVIFFKNSIKNWEFSMFTFIVINRALCNSRLLYTFNY